LRDLAVAVHGGQAARAQAVVEHSLDDHGARRVVGARLRAEPEEADPARIDLVALDQAHYGRRRHRVDALLGTAHAEAAADHRAGLVPRLARPAAPCLEVDPIGRHIDRKSTDPDMIIHSFFPEWPRSRRALGGDASVDWCSHGGDYRAAALESPS